jgi:PKD repeat protein
MGATTPTGTITFKLFAPVDGVCLLPIFQSTVPVSANGSADSSRFWSIAAGIFHWTASYSGDQFNNPVATACGDQSQSVIVAKHYVSAALIGARTGDLVHATLALTGGFSPTGPATFTVTGPNDTFCSGPPVYTSTVAIDGAGNYDSGSFRPTAPGVYKFRIRYEGDDDNYGAGPTACLDQYAAVTVPPAPTAEFTAAKYVASLGQTISFDAGASSDPDGAIASYRWVWGDGTPDGTGMTPNHAFTAPGARSVQLYVTDNDGRTAAVGHGIVAGNALPTAAYTPSTYNPAAGQTVSFDATGSTAPAGFLVSYRWVWGDGTPDGAGPTPTHVFTNPGKVSVGLYLTDNLGQSVAIGHGITVATPGS